MAASPTWDSLVALMRRMDPTSLFRLNQNVAPKRWAAGQPPGGP